MIHKGCCYLVGAGPGQPGLVTIRARELLAHADVIVYDSLINEEILSWASPEAEKIYAGKRAGKHVMHQTDINTLLVDKSRAGNVVVRLKGGDPFIFGRGGEEAEALRTAGIPFEVVPGVTSGVAVPAYAGIPLTHREHAGSVTFVTGHECPKESGETDWETLAALGGTLVIYMGVRNLPNITEKLIKYGMPPKTPAAFVQWGCDPRQKSVQGTLGNLPILVSEANLGSPAIIIIGEVAALHDNLAWYSHKPLIGKKVLITRTREQNSHLSYLLEDLGARVAQIPLISISHLSFELPECSRFDWIVFTSCNAVDSFFVKLLETHDIRALASCKIAAVGPATSDALAAWSIRADFVPERYDAETLATTWPDPGKSVLFACGKRAGQALEMGLKEKNCTMTRLEMYDTATNLAAASAWEAGKDADWILFCSSSAVDSFSEIHEGPLPAGLRTASIGPKTSQSLKNHNLPIHVQAESSTLESLVKAIRQAP